MDVAEAKMIAAAAKPASRRAQRGSAPTSRRNPQVSSVGFGRERRPSSITGCPNPSERSGLVFLGKSKSAFFRRQSAGSDLLLGQQGTYLLLALARFLRAVEYTRKAVVPHGSRDLNAWRARIYYGLWDIKGALSIAMCCPAGTGHQYRKAAIPEEAVRP